jgi:hypothetical protein
LLLECEAVLSEDGLARTAEIADVRAVLVQMMTPPPLRTGVPHNAVLALERTFENQVAELETHCNCAHAAQLSVYQFMHRCEYFEQLVKTRKG